MKRKLLPVASLVVALVLGMGIVPAGAYFTDSDAANGGIEVTVKPSTEIYEYVNDGVKEVTIKSNDDSKIDVFVRAGALTSLGLKEPIAGTNWTGPDGADWLGPDGYGWYYYSEPLAPGASTESLRVAVEYPKVKGEGDIEGAVLGDNANVIVLYESTPVLYKADGTPYADWKLKANEAPEGGN